MRLLHRKANKHRQTETHQYVSTSMQSKIHSTSVVTSNSKFLSPRESQSIIATNNNIELENYQLKNRSRQNLNTSLARYYNSTHKRKMSENFYRTISSSISSNIDSCDGSFMIHPKYVYEKQTLTSHKSSVKSPFNNYLTCSFLLISLLAIFSLCRMGIIPIENMTVDNASDAFLTTFDQELKKIDTDAEQFRNFDDYDFEDSEKYLLDFLSHSSIARKSVVKILVNRFLSASSPDIQSLHTLLDSALEALEISEVDHDPIQINGYPYLFVGSIGAAMNKNSLHKHGITHIVNWSSSTKCNMFDGIKYLCISGVRSEKDFKPDQLDMAVEFIESARKSNGKILSHCWYGKNRSVSLLVAYLMKYSGMSAVDANDLIKETRPQAAPYFDALEEYADYLRKVV